MDQPLVTNQVEFSLLHMDPIYDGTADQCQRLRVLPMAWSPLAKGALMAKTGGDRITARQVTSFMRNTTVPRWINWPMPGSWRIHRPRCRFSGRTSWSGFRWR